MRETRLKEVHEALGARMVPFGGWLMPVQYDSILDEARHVRSKVGLFDLCHMGRFRFEGKDAEALLQKTVTNDVTKIPVGAIRYACVTKEDGGVLDDVLVYRDPSREESFFVVVNASNLGRDLAWFQQHGKGMDCEVRDESEELAMLALQGPRSEAVLQKLCDFSLSDLGYYKWTHGKVDGMQASVSRTGYTGEDGFEIYFSSDACCDLWAKLLEVGAPEELRPIGLGARDTLRLEAGMALYGHELEEDINPLEAGLSWAVRLSTDFIGRDALLAIRDAGGPERKLVGIETESRRVPRQGYALVAGGKEIGRVASGTWSPVREKNIATAFVKKEFGEPGTELAFRVRDKEEAATVVPLPFYKRDK